MSVNSHMWYAQYHFHPFAWNITLNPLLNTRSWLAQQKLSLQALLHVTQILIISFSPQIFIWCLWSVEHCAQTHKQDPIPLSKSSTLSLEHRNTHEHIQQTHLQYGPCWVPWVAFPSLLPQKMLKFMICINVLPKINVPILYFKTFSSTWKLIFSPNFHGL